MVCKQKKKKRENEKETKKKKDNRSRARISEGHTEGESVPAITLSNSIESSGLLKRIYLRKVERTIAISIETTENMAKNSL